MRIGQSLIPEFDMEMASTRKVLERRSLTIRSTIALTYVCIYVLTTLQYPDFTARQPTNQACNWLSPGRFT